MKWEYISIKDVSLGIYDGPHATPEPAQNGPIFLGIKNITEDGHFDFSDIRHISEEEYPKWTKRVTPQANDIVFSYEATLHRYALIPDDFIGCLGRRMALIRPDNSKIDHRYLYYYFFSDEWRGEVNNYVINGATVDRIPLTNFPDFKILVPPLPTQRRIASILSAYDDLIENNLRRIKLLEEAAQHIYREWFVRMRFPGWETVEFGTDGLPEGWRINPAETIFNIKIGRTPPREESEWFEEVGNGVKWVSIKDMNNSPVFIFETSENITDEGVQKFRMNIADVGTVLLSFKLTIGAVAIVSEPMTTNEAIAHFNIIDTNVMSNHFAYCYLKLFPFESLGSTSSIGKALNSKIVKSMPFLIPDQKTLKYFETSVTSKFDLIQNLLIQNTRLKEARDILLPRLMNQTIEV